MTLPHLTDEERTLLDQINSNGMPALATAFARDLLTTIDSLREKVAAAERDMSPAGMCVLVEPRAGRFPADATAENLTTRIEVSFAIPVHITGEQQRAIDDVIQQICKQLYNTPKDGVHWSAESGGKPNWSKADAAFLGKEPSANAPDSGEPSFDMSVLGARLRERQGA